MPIGKGVISGTVVVMGGGHPARRARVQLAGSQEVGGSRSTMTDDSGRFTFLALPEGRFTVSASKAGHITATFGQRSPGRPGTPIQLGDGQKMDVQLTMSRGGVITGTVLDEHGEAIPNTPVRVMRYVMPGGQRTLQQAGNDQTDDRGMYRIFGLQPGDYLVSATPRNVNVRSAAAEQQMAMQSLMQRIEVVGQQNPGQAQMVAERLAQLKATVASTVTAAIEDEQATGYAPVYYPGTTSPASAAMITLGAGEEKANIDFQYQVVPIARVEGTVTSSSGQMPPNVQVTLVNTGFDVPGLNPGGARVDQNGTFRIQNVPPGQYTLIARANVPAGREGGPAGRAMAAPAGRGEAALAGRGRGPGAAPAEPTRMWAAADVTVDGRNVSNVVLLLQPGVPVSGRITFDGTAQPPPADLSRMRVTLQPAVAPGTSGEVASSAAGRVDAEGRFTISSVVPGRYRLTGSGAGAGWFLGSSTIDGQDSLDFPVEIKGGQGVSGAIVTFVDRQSEITGFVTNDRSQPVADYTLVIYPADARYRQPQSRRITSTRPSTDGRFSFRNLPAGEYRLAPVLDPEPGSWYDPAFLQQLDTAAVRITIAEGEKKEQNLRVPGGG